MFQVLREYTVRDYLEVPVEGIIRMSKFSTAKGTFIRITYKSENGITLTRDEFMGFLSTGEARAKWGWEGCADIARKLLND